MAGLVGGPLLVEAWAPGSWAPWPPLNLALRVSQVKPSNCFRLHPTSVISKHSTIPVP